MWQGFCYTAGDTLKVWFGLQRLRKAIPASVLIRAGGGLALAIHGLGSPAPRSPIAATPPSPSETALSSPSPTPAEVSAAPAPRIGAAMAYDATLGKLLLFSGVRGDSSSQAASTWIQQDCWTWDGTDWARLQPASLPPGRRLSALGNE